MTRDIVNSDEKVARQQWRTHPALATWIVEQWRIDLDAMAHPYNTVVPRFICDPDHRDAPDVARGLKFTPVGMGRIVEAVAVDAFAHRWSTFGGSIFINPPFRCLKRPILVDRMLEARADGCTVVMLAPDNGDTRWFARLVDAGAAVWRFRGRPRYLPAGDSIDDKNGASFPSALITLGQHSYPRPKRGQISTYVVDAKTFEVL